MGEPSTRRRRHRALSYYWSTMMIVMRQTKRWARVPVRAMVAVVAAPPCSDAGGSLPVEM